MNFLKIDALGDAKVVSMAEENDLGQLYWKLCIELSATCIGPFANSDILEEGDLVVYGIDKNCYSYVPENEYVTRVLGEKVYGSCMCFSVVKREGAYSIRGLKAHEIAMLVSKTRADLDRESWENLR